MELVIIILIGLLVHASLAATVGVVVGAPGGSPTITVAVTGAASVVAAIFWFLAVSSLAANFTADETAVTVALMIVTIPLMSALGFGVGQRAVDSLLISS